MVFTDSVGKFLFAVETFPIASRPRKHAEFGLNLHALIRTALLKRFGHCCVKTIGREKNMKTSKNIIAGMALFSSLLAFTTSASADWGHRRSDFRRDRQELSAARHELRSDIRRGAGRGEIARDRAAIARERRDIWQDRREWRNDRWHNYNNGRRYTRWNGGWWDHR